jgi:hypothetical protein
MKTTTSVERETTAGRSCTNCNQRVRTRNLTQHHYDFITYREILEDVVYEYTPWQVFRLNLTWAGKHLMIFRQ